MTEPESRWKALEEEIERRLVERFAALRDEFDRLRLESDRRWAGFLDRFEQKLSGIVPTDMLPQAEPAAAPAAAAGVISAEAARALDEAGNQVEALHRFLDLCRGHASRVALLVSRGGAVGVWKALGFSEHGGSDEAARRATPPSEPGSVLARVMEGKASELTADNEVSASLAAEDATRGVLIPMVVKEKISGALYADCVSSEENQFDPEALGFLTFLAGLIVDRLASRKLKPAPALTSLQTGAAAEAAPPPTPTPPPPAPASEREFELAEQSAPHPIRPISGAYRMQTELPTPSVRRPQPPPPFPAPLEEPRRPTAPPFSRPEESIAQPEPSTGLDFAPSVESGRTIRIPSVPADSVPSALASAPAAPAEAPAARPRPSTGARRLGGPLAPLEGDERREEARRFAKLLVSEIKLYNEKAVLQGREQGNIYELLKEDIDRSRQMYDERIPEDVRANSNYFYEELVRILADGHSDALGL
jgi:hypothetical protein